MSKRPYSKKELKRKAANTIDHILSVAEKQDIHPLTRKSLISFLTEQFVETIKYKSPKKSEL